MSKAPAFTQKVHHDTLLPWATVDLKKPAEVRPQT
jgi:hypothetical protein